MKINRLLSALLAFVILACLSGVQGQYVMPLSSSSTTPSTAQSATQYSQYYTGLTGSVPSSHILPPVQFNLTGKTPANVYFSAQMQQVPYSTYQSTASGNALWIQGATDWSQYAIVPQGTMVSLLAITPNEGSSNVVWSIQVDRNITTATSFTPPANLASMQMLPDGTHCPLLQVG